VHVTLDAPMTDAVVRDLPRLFHSRRYMMRPLMYVLMLNVGVNPRMSMPDTSRLNSVLAHIGYFVNIRSRINLLTIPSQTTI
jgi:hypothetical protein